jgi:hypothetical protein
LPYIQKAVGCLSCTHSGGYPSSPLNPGPAAAAAVRIILLIEQTTVLTALPGATAAEDGSADLSGTPKVADEAAAQKTGTDAAAAER